MRDGQPLYVSLQLSQRGMDRRKRWDKTKGKMVNTTDYTDCADYEKVLIVGEKTKNHIKRKSSMFSTPI